MIESLANFHFIRPLWLLLAPLAIVLSWLWWRCSNPLRGWNQQMDRELLAALCVGKQSGRTTFASWRLVSWILAIIAVAGPTWRLEPNPFADDATPLMILLKADISMERPGPPTSAMERAHLKIADLAEVRKGQPLGLIVYAGSAHLVLPPTRDTAIIAQMAAEISPAIMPTPGDRLDIALRKGGQILSASQAGGSLLVIADTADGDPRAAAEARPAVSDFPIQFLALGPADSSETQSLRDAAKVLDASVQPLTVDDSDVQSLTAAAARVPVARPGDATARWHEAGYWLVPLVALLVLMSFRRESPSFVEASA